MGASCGVTMSWQEPQAAADPARSRSRSGEYAEPWKVPFSNGSAIEARITPSPDSRRGLLWVPSIDSIEWQK